MSKQDVEASSDNLQVLAVNADEFLHERRAGNNTRSRTGRQCCLTMYTDYGFARNRSTKDRSRSFFYIFERIDQIDVLLD